MLAACNPRLEAQRGRHLQALQAVGRIHFLAAVGLRSPLSCGLSVGDHSGPRGHPRSLPCGPLHGSLTLPISLHFEPLPSGRTQALLRAHLIR